MSPELDARTVVERYLHEVLSGGRATPADDLVVDASLQQSIQALRTAFGALDVTPRVIVSADGFAAVHLSARGTHRGTFQGIAATGRPWTAGCTAVFRVDGGRIVDAWTTWDNLAILEQLGAANRPAGSSA